MTALFPALILVAGIVDDLRSRKIHNPLIIILFVCSIIYVPVVYGISALLPAFGKMALALVISAPLVLTKIIGGGDMKLYAILALSISTYDLLFSLLFSFFWAAALGVIKAILDKKLYLLSLNLFCLFKLKKVSTDEMSTFPFSVSLFLGWLSATFHNPFW